ncbi:hypothetical protein [Bacillus kwashiorkori]|uniref:hypothetical protein n=1 Tax=Bacillus kwashiorkori TaxID=1522318 RepID=UPI000784F403|nr:hypothetical protein [Bacillus kwashiorkori]
MNLREYVGKKIRLMDVDGQVFEGKCTDYTQALDNEPEIESIGIETVSGADYSYEIYENEIKSIEIIE